MFSLHHNYNLTCKVSVVPCINTQNLVYEELLLREKLCTKIEIYTTVYAPLYKISSLNTLRKIMNVIFITIS